MLVHFLLLVSFSAVIIFYDCTTTCLSDSDTDTATDTDTEALLSFFCVSEFPDTSYRSSPSQGRILTRIILDLIE